MSDADVTMPALQLYDLARAHVAKALSAGAIRVLWNQFPTGQFIPLPYLAFRTIFGHEAGWKRYNPWNPPLTLLERPQAKAKKQHSLSYEFSEHEQVSDFCDSPTHSVSPFRFPTKKFAIFRVAMLSPIGWTLARFDLPIHPYSAAASV